MTLPRLITVLLLLYTLLIPVLAQGYIQQYESAAVAMMGSGIILAFLFWSGRAFVLNLLIAAYVFEVYLIRPYISLFEGALSAESLSYIRGLHPYETPESAAVVYWSLFSLLLAWALGLLLFPTPRREKPVSVPRVFRMLDAVMLRNGLPFLAGYVLLFVLNYQSPESGIRGTQTAEGGATFLLGLASLQVVSMACLFFFLRELHDGRRRPPYLILLAPLISVLQSGLSGSRSAIFTIFVSSLMYWLFLDSYRTWKGLTLIKTALISTAGIVVSIGGALFAQVLRPLYRYSESVSFVDILNVLSYRAVIDTQDVLFRGVTELLYRMNALKGQFYILNEWHVHDPSEYTGPIKTVMRTMNDMAPGELFPGLLTVNQVFDYVYTGVQVYYNSEPIGSQGILYLNFGHLGSFVVVLALGVIAIQSYPWLAQSMRASPALAAMAIGLSAGILYTGWIERIISVYLVRPPINFLIFVLVCTSFSFVLPYRIRFWSPTR